MSRMKVQAHRSSMKFLAAGVALLFACVAAPAALAQVVPLTSFNISTNSPGTPLLGPNQLVVSLTLTGNTTVAPTGNVDVFTSTSSSCASQPTSTDFGTQTIIANAAPPAGNDYSSTASYTINTPPVGTYYVCATYAGDANYAATSTNPGAQLTYYAATTLTVLQQSFSNTVGQPISISLALSTPTGQATPTGTISVYDGLNTTGAPLATATAGATGISPSTVTVTPSSTQYTVVYSGEANLYASEQFTGTVYTPNALTSVSPAIIQAGSGATTVTALGYGFVSGPTGSSGSAGSTIQVTDSTGIPNYLPTTFISSNEVTASIPASILAAAHNASFLVGNINTLSNLLHLNIYSPQANTVTATTSTPSVPYGSFQSVSLGATVAGLTDPGLPTGSVSFALTPTGSTTPIPLGSATLSSATTNGALVSSAITTNPVLPPTRAFAADLNGDGLTDIVALPSIDYTSGNDYPPPYLQVHLSTAANSFESEQDVPTGCNPQDFAVGDINGDGIPDLVVLCAPGENVVATYMLGTGNGTFQPPQALAATSALQNPTNIVMGDFNGDGAMDVAIYDDYAGQIQVYTGSKSFGTFTALPASTFPAGSSGVTAGVVADFNQDGKSDIVTLQQPYQTGVATLELLTSNGDGTFTAHSQTFTTPTFFLQPPSISDVNGDGYPDVLVADTGVSDSPTDTGQILVFENNGSGTLNPPLVYSNSTYPTAALVNPQTVVGAPYPIIGKPATSSVSQRANIFFTAYVPATEAMTVTGLDLSGTTFTPVYTAQSADYDVTSYGGEDLVVAGDFNGDEYNDAAVFSNTNTSALTPVLTPFYYTNSSTVSLPAVTQQPAAGTYNLTATYSGATDYASGASPSVPITITQAPAVTSLTGPTTIQYGDNVTYVATISGVPGGTIPTGTVDFNFNGIDESGPVTLVPGTNSATATFTISSLNAFYPSTTPNTVTASYSGDSNYLSSAFGNGAFTVSEAQMSLNLTSSATAIKAGTVVNFTATLSDASGVLPSNPYEYITINGLPTGANSFSIPSNGQLSINFGTFAPGSYTIQASYPSDGYFSSATSQAISLRVDTDAVHVSIASNSNPVTYPAPVELTANVSASGLGLPTGAVNFSNNGSSLGTGTLSIVNGASGMNPVGTFDSTTTANIVAEAVGDFNHDGKPDLAVLQTTGTTATLLVSLGNGDGTFQAPVSYTVDSGSDAITAADFNNDGYTDLAISSTSGAVSIYLATGSSSGALQLNQTLNLSSTFNLPTAIASGDFNKDGLSDLAVISGGVLNVFLNSGAGSFSSTPDFVSGQASAPYTGIAVADFNKDGYPDIAVCHPPISGDVTVPAGVDIYTNNAQSSLGFTKTSYTVQGAFASNASSNFEVATGDFNGDGYPDLAVLNEGNSTMDVLINQNGAFPSESSYAVVGEPVGIATADFNKDGYDDIAITGVAGGPSGGTDIFFGSPTGALTSVSNLPNAYGYSIAAADLNGDGNPDLMVAFQSVASFIDSSLRATLSNVVLPVGTDPLTGAYVPDSAARQLFNPSTSTAINETVHPATPVVTWQPPTSIVYGTALGATQLNATASVPGSFTYTPASGTVLSTGTQTLSVLFTPTSSNYALVTVTVPITVTQATPVVTWSSPAPISYGTALSAAQLNATASVPGTFIYTPAAGTVLSVGTHTLNVVFTPTDRTDYTTATASVTLAVNASSTISAIQPSSGNLGDPATTVTITGFGFLSNSVAQLNGSALTTTYVSATELQAVVPANFFTTVQSGSITVDTPGDPLSAAVQFNVLAPTAQITFTGPSNSAPGSQPAVNFQFAQSYPVPVTATFTLTVQPATSGGVTDPAVQFASGGDTYTVTIPANSTTAVPVQLQTGTLAGTITVTATLNAGGTDITPTSLQPVVIQVPQSAPVLSSVSLVRSGTTLTVTVQGYSSTREIQSAQFHFTGLNGQTLANPDVIVQLGNAFTQWYSSTLSNQYGSAFSYTQSFTLSQDASTIGSVSVTLTNSVGTSNSESAQ